MTVATTECLEHLYGMLKQHERTLARVACSGFRIESDIFGELLFSTRAMALELEELLTRDRISPSSIRVPETPERITPRVLRDQRQAFCPAYQRAVEELAGDASVVTVLKRQQLSLNGEGRERLDVLCAAVVGGQ